MKTISLLLFLGLIFFQLDAQTRKEKKAFKEKEIKELIDGGRYKFVARNALPMGGGSIDLTSEYDLVIDSTRIKSFLPFFGRAYHVGYGDTEGGIKFDETAQEFSCNYYEKKKSYIIEMTVKGEKDVYDIRLNAGTSGFASLFVNSNNRQSISFNGTIEKLK